MKLANKTALITGAAGGFGSAIAMAFADQGADIVLTDIREKEMQCLIDKIKDKGNKIICIKTDITREEHVLKMKEEALKHFYNIDILINNAGIARDCPIQELKVSDWETTMAVNLKGAFLCTKALIGQMIDNKSGKVINISSISGQTGRPVGVDYAASKAGLLGFTRTLALEVAVYGINVNAIAPGPISTPLFEKLDDSTKNRLQATIPFKRVGNVSDVANVALFLASSDSDWITGETIAVNGGAFMS